MDQNRQSIIDTEKFNKVFGSIEKQLLMQSSFLESIYNIQTQRLDMDRDRDKREAARLAALAAQGTEETIGGADKSGAVTDLGTANDQQKESILSKLIPGIGNFIGSLFGTIGGKGLAGLGSKVLGAGTLAILAPAIGDFVAGFTRAALNDMDLPVSDIFKSNLAASLGNAAEWTAIGSIFGRKFAFIFGTGSLLSDAITAAMGIDANKKFIDAFGVEFTNGDIAQIGSTAALLFGPSLFSNAFSKLPENATFMDKFKKGFSTRLLSGAAIVTLGEIAANVIENLTGSKELGDVASWTSYGASIGGMFGPKGMLIGAIAGFAIGAGYAIDAYAKKRAQDAYNNAVDEIDRLSNEVDTAVASGDANTALNKANQALNNYRKVIEATGVGSIPLDELSELEKNLNTSLLGLQRLDPEAYNTIAQQAADLKSQIAFSQGSDKSSALESYVLDTLRAELSQEQIKNLDEDTLKSIIENTIADSSIRTDRPTIDSVVNRAYQKLINPSSVSLNPASYQIMNDRSDAMLIERIQKLQSASQQPQIIPVPMPMPGGSTSGPTQVDQSTTSNSTVIYSGRSKFDELDTFVIGAR